MNTVWKYLCVLLGLFCWCTAESEHRTKAASEKHMDLYCYKCDTIIHGDKCYDLKENSSNVYAKCANDQRICQVQTITMSSSTEDAPGLPKLWMLQRNCSKICEPVCVTIGERTKLRSCTTCCETSFCNSGNGGNAPRIEIDLRVISAMFLCSFSFLITTKNNIPLLIT